MVGIWMLVACQVPCERQPAGAARDACTYAQVLDLGPDKADHVVAKVQTIDDPVIHGAAVIGWVGEHARTLAPSDGRRVCGLLDGPDQGQCLRRLQSAHLLR